MAQLHRHRVELRFTGMKSILVLPRPHQFFGKRFTALGIPALCYGFYAGLDFSFFSFYLANLSFYASILRSNLLLPLLHLKV
jgi:hypothetical protein